MKTADRITIEVSRGDALKVGQTLRSLARAAYEMPRGIDREAFERVGLALAQTAITAPVAKKDEG